MPDNVKDVKHLQPSYHIPSYQYKEHWTTALGDHVRNLTVQLLSTGGAGAVAKTAVAPLDRAKALYRGNGANILRLVPDVGVRYLVHDQFSILFSPVDGSPMRLKDRVAAGAATGMTKTLMFYPLDLCYTRIAADTSASGQGRLYSGVRQCLVQAWQREGLRGWYRGMGMSLLMAVPNCAVSFTTYDELKSRLPTDKRSRAAWWYPWAKMGCGAAAGAAAQLATYPLDTLRRRLQVSGGAAAAVSYRSVLPLLHSVLTQEGVMALYRGCAVAVVKVVPGSALQFMVYDLIRCGMTMMDPTSNVQSPL